jgi:hypothetical protein
MKTELGKLSSLTKKQKAGNVPFSDTAKLQKRSVNQKSIGQNRRSTTQTFSRGWRRAKTNLAP